MLRNTAMQSDDQSTEDQPESDTLAAGGKEEQFLSLIEPVAYSGSMGQIHSLHDGWRLFRDWCEDHRSYVSLCLGFILACLLWGGIFLYFSLTFSATSHSLEHTYSANHFFNDFTWTACGNSIAEAKDLGCVYDILSNAWFPSNCIDQESVKEYQADGSWYGFADENRTQILSIETMSEMDFYYTSIRDHIVHCAMLWRKQYRVLIENRAYIDSTIADREHTMHCSRFLVDMSEGGEDYWNMPIKVFVRRGLCWTRN